jgi:hypothetical protein
MAGACGAPPDQVASGAQRTTVWHQVGSWTGHGNRQTESFTSETGVLRVRWETRHEAAPGAGVFHMTANSAISGRLLQEVVDRRGIGHGIEYVQQDPHVFYIVVESRGLEWEFTVEEAIVYP